jgi:plastocyanin
VRRTTRFAQITATVAAFAVLMAACGDDDDTGTSTTNTTENAPAVSLEGRVNDHGSKDLGSGTDLDLELDDSYFAPTFVTAEAGKTVTVKLENEGDSAHTFTIDGTDIDEQVQPGQSATVEVELPDEGTLAYYCRFHVSGGMQGAFVVSGSGSAPAGGPATTSSSSSGGLGY